MAEFTINDILLDIPDERLSGKVRKRLEDGDYEGGEAAAARLRIKPGLRVLELGAGAGFVSCVSAGQAGAENVLAVEANPEMIPIIRANLDRNGHQATRLLHGAVTGPGNDAKTVDLHMGQFFVGSTTRPEEGARKREVVQVPALPIRELVRDHRPHVVMMDVEGSEAELFDELWDCPLRFIVLELHPNKYPQSTIQKIFDWAAAMRLVYDTQTSRGRVLGLRRLWDET